MTMIINIPERVLLIKVSGMRNGRGEPTGYTLVFHDITELVAGEAPAAQAGPRPATSAPGTDHHRRLLKVPTLSGQRIVLVDAADIQSIRSDGHYTRVRTREGEQFCNLAISDLASRLDPEQFMRVHRSHLVNLCAVSQLLREDGRLALALAHGDGEPIPVSRSSAAELLRRLGVAPPAPSPDPTT
jgi:DNA-binding LytR/AlgR family response regulator